MKENHKGIAPASNRESQSKRYKNPDPNQTLLQKHSILDYNRAVSSGI